MAEVFTGGKSTGTNIFDWGKSLIANLGGFMNNPERLDSGIEQKATGLNTFTVVNSVTKDPDGSNFFTGLTNPFNYAVQKGVDFGKMIFGMSPTTTAVLGEETNFQPVSQSNSILGSLNSTLSMAGNMITETAQSAFNIWEKLRGAVEPQQQDAETGVKVTSPSITSISDIQQEFLKLIYTPRNTSSTSGVIQAFSPAQLSFSPSTNEQVDSKQTISSPFQIPFDINPAIFFMFFVIAILIFLFRR